MSLQKRIIGVLTAKEFEAAVSAFPRLSENGKEAAKLVLVDGLEQVEVAERFKLHRQQINKWVKDIYQSHIDCPAGWKVDVVTLPPEQMDEVKIMERRARREHDKKFPSETGQSGFRRKP
jgi:transposase-like protein